MATNSPSVAGFQDYPPKEVLDDLQKELDALDDEDDDDYDDDDDDDDDNDEPKDHAPDPNQQQVSALEEQLVAATKELTAIRSERGKQRTQLDELTKENASLQNQKELRLERIKLQEQAEELQGMLDDKAMLQQIAMEDLEQSKTHYRQLQRTLKLLQGGVEHILEQSATDQSTTPEGKERASRRQALLKELLEKDWKSQLSMLSTHEELHDGDDDDDDSNGGIQLFHKKNRRYDSIESMMSEIASISPADNMLVEPPTNRSTSNRAAVLRAAQNLASSSTREGRSRTRSKFYLEEERELRTRSLSRSRSASGPQRSLEAHADNSGEGSKRRRSRSRSRKGTLRRTKSLTMPTSPSAALGDGNNKSDNSTSGAGRRKMSLMRMLDQSHNEDGDEDGDGGNSEDTPRTTNTQG